MGWIQRLFGKSVDYEDQSPKEDAVTMRDLLRFAEKQSEQNSLIVQAVLAQGASQARVMEQYIELFKPRNVPSTTLEERENAKSANAIVREDEWVGVESPAVFNELSGYMRSEGIPPEPEEF